MIFHFRAFVHLFYDEVKVFKFLNFIIKQDTQ